MDAWALIAERRILEAMEEGKFANLSCRGRPLAEENFSFVPEDLRLSLKILRNAGALPPQVQVLRDVARLKEALRSCRQPEERSRLEKELALKTTHLGLYLGSLKNSSGV